METHPNQSILKIIRNNVNTGTGKERPFLIAYQDTLKEAMTKLNGTAFKVYLFLLFNRDQFVLAYSPKYISKEIGICADSVRSAFRQLKAKGYIIINDKGKEIFYEVPRRVSSSQTNNSQTNNQRTNYTWE